MTPTFKIVLQPRARCVPHESENLGNDLRTAAKNILTKENHKYTCGRAAVLLYLAADAYEHGASASIGHNRAERYEQAAHECRIEADRITAE